MKYFVILIIFFIAISINNSYAEMSYSELQDFCKEDLSSDASLDCKYWSERGMWRNCIKLD